MRPKKSVLPIKCILNDFVADVAFISNIYKQLSVKHKVRYKGNAVSWKSINLQRKIVYIIPDWKFSDDTL